MRIPSRLVQLALAAALVPAGCGGAPARTLDVFAAASLTDVAEVLADSFAAAHPGVTVRVNPAASSLLARQIAAGAPADVFFSASTAWMDYLVAEGRIADPVRRPVGNRLVVAGPASSVELPGLGALAGVGRLALADPGAVPAGVYARAGLVCAGLWETVAPYVVPALDVRAALLAVQQGAADAAVVYASDLHGVDGVRVLLRWPDAAHPRVRYAVAAVRGSRAPDLAAAFVDFSSDPRRAPLWRRYGFDPAPEDVAAAACLL